MATEVDARVISSFSAISENAVNTLLENPTTELVRSLLQSITTKAQEYEQIQTQKLRVEVELETVVRSNESKVKVLKNSVDKALAESTRLRTELSKSGKARKFLPCVLKLADWIRTCSV